MVGLILLGQMVVGVPAAWALQSMRSEGKMCFYDLCSADASAISGDNAVELSHA